MQWARLLCVLVLAAPVVVSAQSYETVNFVNETDQRLGIQISGSPVPPRGGKSMLIKPRESAALRVASGRQQLRVLVIQMPVPFLPFSTAPGARFEKLVDVEPGVIVRITDTDVQISPPMAGAGVGQRERRSVMGRTESEGAGLGYAGYSARFTPVKALILRGEHDNVRRMYREGDQKIRESCGSKEDCYVSEAGFLGLVERGTLDLDMGQFVDSVDAFQRAEVFLELSGNESKSKEWFKKGLGFLLETVSGYEEIGQYYGEGFERVLMLNYKTIGYMLRGERKAYNVTRRAIDWQNMERLRFEEKLREVEKELREKESTDASRQVRDAYAQTDAKASTVASAYVNPFGYYMAGVIQEFESLNDPSLASNAVISYRKALELNPQSLVIQEALRELEQSGTRAAEGKLVHVVVNDGFVPEKMVLTHHFQAGASRTTGRPVVVPLKLPYYRPVANRVHRIVVETPEGRELATLSSVADVEALVLRHQKDLQAFLTVRGVLSTLRNTFWSIFKETGAIGTILGEIMLRIGAPDTRSWMTLPGRIQAARLSLPAAAESIVITTYDAPGQKLATQVAKLDETGATFVYGRSLDERLIVHASPVAWVNANAKTQVVAR